MQSTLRSFLQNLGPGLLYTGAAVGVSHLVQSTRAGADYGMSFILIIILIHIFKYRFFKAGPWYAIHHKKSIVEGYLGIGKWAFYTFLAITLFTMFPIVAAVSAVTAGILGTLLPIGLSPFQLQLLVVLGSCAILAFGKLKTLNSLISYLVFALSLTVLLCVILNLGNGLPDMQAPYFPDLSGDAGIIYLLAFLGWMPAPLDLAAWHSIWQKESDIAPSKWNFDFEFGYWGTAILAVVFLFLGITVFYGSGIPLERSAGGFSNQLIQAIGDKFGTAGLIFAGVAAFGAMLSTNLTVMDAIPRVWKEASHHVNSTALSNYKLIISILSIGGIIILAFFGSRMIDLVEFATIISFLATPILAVFHFKLCPELFKGMGWQIYAYVSIAILTILSVWYCLVVLL